MPLSSTDIIKLLNLTPHTCGYTNESYLSDLELPAAAIPAAYGDPRHLGDVLYFLVTQKASVQLHRIRSDQMYHHYLGDPLEVLLLYQDGTFEIRIVGPDLAAGARPQLFIPGGTFHTARVKSGGIGYALLGTSVWLRAEPADVELGDPQKLMAACPTSREAIAQFTTAASSS